MQIIAIYCTYTHTNEMLIVMFLEDETTPSKWHIYSLSITKINAGLLHSAHQADIIIST